MEKAEKRRLFLSLIPSSLFVFFLLLIKLLEWQFDWQMGRFGILPREIIGLRGILFSPLIHGDFNHLFNNGLALLALGWTLFYFYKNLALRIVIWSWLLAGLYTWISARHNYHIGASGLVYSLFGFLFISGFLRRSNSLIAISFLVAFLYGSLVWGVLPWDQKMSWEGHFWGLLVGIVLAVYYRKQGPQRKVYEWTEEEEESPENLLVDSENTKSQAFEYEYHYVPKSKKDED
jgi:membrane associated rhomboid family serine protease